MSEGGGAAADQSVWSFGFSPKIDHHRILPNTYYTLPTTYMQTFILLHYCILTKHTMLTLAIVARVCSDTEMESDHCSEHPASFLTV